MILPPIYIICLHLYSAIVYAVPQRIFYDENAAAPVIENSEFRITFFDDGRGSAPVIPSSEIRRTFFDHGRGTSPFIPNTEFRRTVFEDGSEVIDPIITNTEFRIIYYDDGRGSAPGIPNSEIRTFFENGFIPPVISNSEFDRIFLENDRSAGPVSPNNGFNRIFFQNERRPAPVTPSTNFGRPVFGNERVTAPFIPSSEFSCGYTFICTVYYGILYNSTSRDTRDVYIYYLNKTAEIMERQGYRIEILSMYDDFIENMTISRGSFYENVRFLYHAAVAPAGAEPAEPERAQYMAQLGQTRAGGRIEFLCDGTLINRNWVLTAAHCFFSPTYTLDVLRLGDYDVTVPPTPIDRVHGKKIEDYPITNVVVYPDYNPKYRYHDIALVPLPRKTPKYHPSINPACLPWKYVNHDFRNKQVVLTGWGATKYGGRKSPSLLQVKLKVYDTQVCNAAYSRLPRFWRKHPNGLTEDTIMCVGWDVAGKDACNGDSGAPLVFGDDFDVRGDFTVIGVVSGGHGCGLQEYPGLYIPINKPRYLRWIKEVAFKGF